MVKRFYLFFFLTFVGIIVSFVVAGLVSHFVGPGAGLVVAIVGVTACSLYCAFAFKQPSKADVALEHDGIEADAVITAVRDTGISTGQLNYGVRLILRVEPSNGAPFVSEAEAFVSRVSIPPVGGRVRVKYDPARPGHAVLVGNVRVGEYGGVPVPAEGEQIDTDAVVEFMKDHGLDQAVATGQSLVYSTKMSPDDATKLLQAAEEQLLELNQTGVGAKAVVIEVHELGVMVNGNNQGVTIKLTVMPDDGEAFSAEATGIISEKSWPNYQAGKMIWVHFDPKDRSRVSFWKVDA